MSAAHESASAVIWQPKDAAEAWKLKQEQGAAAVYAAGTTLLRTQWEAGLAVFPAHVIDLSHIPALLGVSAGEDEALIGAMTTLSELRHHPIIRTTFPLLAEAARSIAAPAVRNLATIGGNICSLTGDAIPALLAYDAELIWQDGDRLLAERITDWLDLLAIGAVPASRLLVQIRLPIPEACRDSLMNEGESMIAVYRKVGRREAFTPSVVTVALRATIASNGQLSDVRLAAGGGQTRPARLERCELLIQQQTLGVEWLGELHAVFLTEYEPKGDPFASTEYRKMTAANLIVAELWSAWQKPAARE